MNLSVAQGSSRRSSLANKRTERLAKENEIIKEETSGLWRFLEKVGLSATASELTGIKASTRTPQTERHQKSEIRAASVSTPTTTTTTSEEPASPPKTREPQRSVYVQSGAPSTDVTDVTPSATLSAESSLPSHASPSSSLPSSLPSPPPAPPPPKPPPPPPKHPPPHPTRSVTQKGLQRDPHSASVSQSDDVTPSATQSAEPSLPSDTSLRTSLPSNKPPPPAPKPPPRPATSQRPQANQPAFLDSINKGGFALKPKDERAAREASRAKKPADEVPQKPADDVASEEIAGKLAAALAARRGAIGDGKDDEDADWDFGRTRVRKRPKVSKTKTRPYL